MVSAFNVGILVPLKQPSMLLSSSTLSLRRDVFVVSMLATSSSSNTAATDNYNKIKSALLSPSGKLTISPELTIPEPKDPTAFLLLTNAIQTLSSRVRVGMANVVFIQSNSLDSIRTFAMEQQNAFGNFPSPVPIIYCPNTKLHSDDNDDETLADIADAGANGILIPVHCQGDYTRTDIENWKSISQRALAEGLQPIPEIIIESDIVASITESYIENLVDALTTATDNSLAACVLSIPPMVLLNEKYDEEEDDDDDMGFKLFESDPKKETKSEPSTPPVDGSLSVELPKIPKALGKKVPILGSIRVPAGDNRLSVETATLKSLGYTGAFLRVDCIPGYQTIQHDLSVTSQFWSACITDLKSLKSKSFGFRSKNNMDMTSADKWIRYRKSVLDSGALGDPDDNESAMSGLDTTAGDYRGFA